MKTFLTLILCAPLMAQNLISVSPAPWAGGTQVFTFRTAAPATFGDTYYFAFVTPGTTMNAQQQPANACVIQAHYQPPHNSFAALAPDGGSFDFYSTTGAVTPLESGFYTNTNAIANNACTVHSYVDGSGESLQADGTIVFNLYVDFNVNTFGGVKYLFSGFRQQSGLGPFWIGPWLNPDSSIAQFTVGLGGGTGHSFTPSNPGLPASAVSDYAGSLQFVNTTAARGGQNNYFLVGDTYHFEVAGPAGAPINVTRYQNGVQTSSLNLSLDANGFWIYDGVTQQAEMGSWTESWNVGGKIFPILTFSVGPTSGFIPTVTYSTTPGGVNQGSGLGAGTQTFHVGQQIYIHLHGLPNGYCYRYGTYTGYNGEQLMNPAPQDVIWLSSTGDYSWSYAIPWWHAGSWVENWQCNAVPAFPAMVTTILQ